MRDDSSVDVRGLVTIPALIALGVTLLRLFGELFGGPDLLFNRAGGGGGALIGIVWLVPVFGCYFGWRLVRSGHGPAGAGRVIGWAVLALATGFALVAGTAMLTGDPNAGMTAGAALAQQLGFAVASLVALLVVRSAWPALFRVLLVYAFASRIPVVLVMFVSMLAGWATHYSAGPPGYPDMGFVLNFVTIALLPQLTAWIMFTVVVGTLFAGIAAFAAGRGAGPATNP